MLPEINKYEFKDYSNEVNHQIMYSMIMLGCLLVGFWLHYQLVHPWLPWCALGL